jgi:hypothetical protein
VLFKTAALAADWFFIAAISAAMKKIYYSAFSVSRESGANGR